MEIVFELIKGWKYEQEIKKDLIFLKAKNPFQFTKFNDYIERENKKGYLLIQASLYGHKYKQKVYTGLLQEYFNKDFIDLCKSIQMKKYLTTLK